MKILESMVQHARFQLLIRITSTIKIGIYNA